MIDGEIVFREGDSEQVNALRINGVLVDPGRIIPVRLLGKAQQILQMNFHQRMANPKIEVLDVVLMNLFHLGHMTESEFRAVPEGQKLQERTQVAPVADLETAVAEAEGLQSAANEE
jgi:hypothetical protein